MNENNSDRDPLEELAAEFTERCRRGEDPSVEEYATRYPAMARDIRDLFSMILQVEHAKSAGTGSFGPRPPAVPPVTTRLGDFRIIREIGHGGMGVVYEAEQESLGRRVAIKVLPQQYLSSRTRRERFEREARTAAQLHHTNIVQIFGVGEQEGRPYFVMQYIRGVGLDAVFSRLASGTLSPRSGRSRRTSLDLASSDLVQVARELLDTQDSSQPPAGGAITTSAVLSAFPIIRPSGAPETLPEQIARLPENRGGSGSQRHEAGQRRDDLAYWHNLARLFAQAADALSFAHRQGVLHRDIKPANLLLDTDGVVWVTDFGLAKTEGLEELTQVGDVVGTLRYMAPEQHRGLVDERSDVYSLGITLYELATLRPAFVESGNGGLLKAILEEPLFPPRRLCPSMPHDLETIILKAAAREPRHRYASAAELRDDLLRLIEDRPIRARRASAAERLWRWSRRNPALATTTGLTLALLVSIAAITSAAYVKVRRANSITRTALLKETHQRERAEATTDLAVAALDAIFDEFAPAGPVAAREVSLGSSDEEALVVTVPSVLSPETAAFLKGMLRFYRGLSQQQGDSPSLFLKMAAAPRRVGEICALLGQYQDAQDAYKDSINQYERLRRTAPDDVRLDVALARARIQLGLVYAAQDEGREAYEQYDTARRILQPRFDRGNASEEARYELARACYLLSRPPDISTPIRGAGPRDDRRPAPPPEGPPEAMPPPDAPPRPLTLEPPPPPQLRDLLPGSRPEPGQPDARGQLRRFMNRNRAELQQAIDILTRLSQEKPKAPEYRQLLAQCLREPSMPPPGTRPAAGPTTRPTSDNEMTDRAVKILEGLVLEFPHVPQYQFDLSETYDMQARGTGSTERIEKAAAIMQTLVSQWPNVPSYRFSLGRIHFHLAQALHETGKTDEVLANLQRAMELQAVLVRQHPAVQPYVMTAAAYEVAIAEWYERQSQNEQARKLLESAVNRMNAVVTADARKPRVRPLAAHCYMSLARVCHNLGDEQRARQAREKAATLMNPRDLRPPRDGTFRVPGATGDPPP